ncbi:MAG: hypothetical protein ACOYOA_15335, partial [Saprospiraceae bacterium]
MKQLTKCTILAIFFLSPFTIFCHDLNMAAISIREWHMSDNKRISASLLMIKNDKVFLENEDHSIVSFPI